LRARALSTFFGSVVMLITGAPAALAASSGGVEPGSPARPASAGSSPAPATVKPAPAIRTTPVTTRVPKLSAYRGPLYERMPTGEVVPYQPPPPAGPINSATGGSAVGGSPVGVAAAVKPDLLVPGSLARYVNGVAAAPMAAPAPVQEAVWAANQIIGLPYVYGGGHASFQDGGYDCSGTVSYALHGGGLLATPEDSSELMSWGSHGAGRWIAVFSNPGHAYVDIAGLRLDTSAADDPSNQQGPRWRPLRTQNSGYTVRHPLGL
jgi:cell wall-associated NlpC family hydrolase